MLWRKKSLRSRLIVQLVLVQGTAILLTAILAILATALLFDITRQVANPQDADVVAQALDWNEGGELVLTPTPELESLRQEAPGFWAVAQDERGQQVTIGTIPPVYRSLAEHITVVGWSNLRGYGPSHEMDAFVKVFNDGTQRLHVMVGSGRLIDIIPAAMQAINQYLLLLFAVLAIATTAIIPWIIRREVRAVEVIAAEADAIDLQKRGTELGSDRLPLEIQPIVRAFNRTLRRMDKTYTRQQRFLAAAAHELKTPIAILQTRIETLVHGPERQQLLLDVARLNNLAEQLLDVQRLEHKPDEDASTDLVALARNVVADLAPLAIAAGYEIAFDSDLPHFHVRGEAGAIERVVINLVQNAMAHGGGRGEIGVMIDKKGALEVHDQGPGVPDLHKEEIFEPFHRVQPSNRGAGLGLSLVNDIVRLHSGQVSVEDRLGGGTIFRVVLPPL